jgi:hypothetical protein
MDGIHQIRQSSEGEVPLDGLIPPINFCRKLTLDGWQFQAIRVQTSYCCIAVIVLRTKLFAKSVDENFYLFLSNFMFFDSAVFLNPHKLCEFCNI